MEEKNFDLLKPGDIILSGHPNSIIKYVMQFFQEDPVEYSHASKVSHKKSIFESHFKIREVSFDQFFKKKHPYKIIRYKLGKEKKNIKMSKQMEKLLNLPYGFSRLFLYLFDCIFKTTFFTNLLKSSKNQVCSSYVAWGYYVQYKYQFENVSWRSCNPDNIDNESIQNPDLWEIVAIKK